MIIFASSTTASRANCHKREIDPWTGQACKDNLGRKVLIICSRFIGGTTRYMSEELVGLRRDLAAAASHEEHERVKEKKEVTASTTDVVAGALTALEFFTKSNAWPLIEEMGIDGGAVRKILAQFVRKPALAEVEAWGPPQVNVWLGGSQNRALANIQPLVAEHGVDGRALIKAAVAGNVKLLFPEGIKVKAGAISAFRVAARGLPTLEMPAPLVKVLEESLDADVAKRPRDASEMCSPYGQYKFGKWCKEATKVGDVKVRIVACILIFPTMVRVVHPLFLSGQMPATGRAAHRGGHSRHAATHRANPSELGRIRARRSGAA